VNIARGLERRVESLMETLAGRFFSGALHPSEIASRLAREADFARYEHRTGPATANHYTLQINPSDLTGDPGTLESDLAAAIDTYAAEEGLRLEGPARVVVTTSAEVASGTLKCRSEVITGRSPEWGRLQSSSERLGIEKNRSLIGRSPTCDLVLPYEDVSREHSLVWREAGRVFVSDLDSSNGVMVDGAAVGIDPVAVSSGSIIGIGSHRYRLVVH
jgi:hypothetical protein